MNIEVGQWYRCRDERMLGHVVGRVLGENTYPFAVVLYRDRKYHDVVAMTVGGRITDPDEHSFDLVEHLPDCTGPNWKPQKWRKANSFDAAKLLECRFFDTVEKCFKYAKLTGFHFGISGDWYLRILTQVGSEFWIEAKHVEVLDD